MFSPIKGFCKSRLFTSLSHELNGGFYRSASTSLLATSKPWVHGCKNNFTKDFDGSGMFRDTRIDSLLKERETKIRSRDKSQESGGEGAVRAEPAGHNGGAASTTKRSS
jgi:hypothetical protein